MKAFLLAAGLGTRLKPITDNKPKCLVPINGQPLLGWWLKLLEKHQVTDVLINMHYLSEQVVEYIHSLTNLKIKVHLVYEKELLGSGGTVKKNIDFISDDKEENFLICYADNLTCMDLNKMAYFHQKYQDILTMGLFYANNPSQCGIANLNEENMITQFIEKPIAPKSNLANAGIYVTSKKIVKFFPNQKKFDFGHDVLPLLINNMRGYIINEYLLDIGTVANYWKANGEWKNDYISNTI